jgi:hypothetical protein
MLIRKVRCMRVRRSLGFGCVSSGVFAIRELDDDVDCYFGGDGNALAGFNPLGIDGLGLDLALLPCCGEPCGDIVCFIAFFGVIGSSFFRFAALLSCAR